MLQAFIADPKTWLGLIASGVVWWLARRDMRELRKRVMDCEIDRASLHEKDRNREAECTRMQGAIDTLTALLKREVNLD